MWANVYKMVRTIKQTLKHFFYICARPKRKEIESMTLLKLSVCAHVCMRFTDPIAV
jgi:hypothetical protein